VPFELPNLVVLASETVDPELERAFRRNWIVISTVAAVILLILAVGLLLAFLRERRQRRNGDRARSSTDDDEDGHPGQGNPTATTPTDDRRKNRLLHAINTLLRQEIYGRNETELANGCLAFAQELSTSKFGMLLEVGDDSVEALAIRDATGAWGQDASVEDVLAAQPHRARELWDHVTRRHGEGGYADAADRPVRPRGAFRNMLMLPVRRQGELELILLLAASEQGYSPADLEDLGALAVAYLEALRRCRSERLIGRVRKQLEEKAEELERSNEELEQFAQVASHDLQEPLRKITAFGDRLQESMGECGDERTRLYLDRMIDAASRMRRLIDDLLQYSRVTRGPRELRRVDLEDVVRRLEDDLSVDGELAVELQTLPAVGGNAMQLRLLMQNLLSNARKFRKPGQQARVTVRSEPVDDEHTRICVEDEGIGMDEKFAERIFRPFQRLHSRSEYPGTGIGLAICQKIVRSHGGSISVHSQPGQGTRFEVVLPVWKGESSDEEE
jgi:signal transduction histidine kinase